MAKITAHKLDREDAHSWRVFLNDRPVVTGLSKRQVPDAKRLVADLYGRDASRRHARLAPARRRRRVRS